VQKSQIDHVGSALAVQQRPLHDNGEKEIPGYLVTGAALAASHTKVALLFKQISLEI
jgi:hypothetical protein